MKKDKISYTELTYQVVQQSPDPLPFDEILRRVHAIQPIKTKNPKSTIRSAIGQGRSIVATGDGRYGWKPRLITGSVLRLTLGKSDLSGQAVEFGNDMRDALWPAFLEIQKRIDRSPIQLQLPDGSKTSIPLDFFGKGHWGTSGSPEFWAWFKTLKAKPGDHLIFQVLDGMAKLSCVEFQARSQRDEAAVAARNQAILQAALAFVRNRWQGAAIWDLVSHLLATGQYKHPVPPDPFSEIWTPQVWKPTVAKKEHYGGWSFIGGIDASPVKDELLQGLFGGRAQVYDYENPPDLPPEYRSGGDRRPRPSRKAQRGPVGTLTLRASHRALPGVWRDIEIAEDQTLEDLHLVIQRAFEWNDDHLYSFFMSGRREDYETEVGCPWSETSLHTHQVEMGGLHLQVGRKFLYFFDYGDSHEFDVEVLQINPAAPKNDYPRIVARQGKAPPQYPECDEETGEPIEWDPYRHWKG